MADRVRLDRWLWAARFFKTRAQAKTAIEGGKVDFHLSDGTPGKAQGSESQDSRPQNSRPKVSKPKVSKEVSVGDTLTVRRGYSPETVIVTALSERRGSAAVARTLYEETTASIEARETEIARRRMEHAGLRMPEGRPGKRDRRELKKLKEDTL